MSSRLMVAAVASLLSYSALADPTAAESGVPARADAAIELAQTIWTEAELGYQETRSSAALQAFLRKEGFAIETGQAGIPTAFVAAAGSGKPVIAILAEFDALPGLSQAAVPKRQPLIDGGAGHACGHHLFGAASATAGAALAQWLERENVEGTVRVIGTPAEEGGSGKVYLTRAGVFDDVDTVLHWHPGAANIASPGSTTANKSGRFEFHGVAAHAARAPHRGRSALDGVEAMNYMVNLMREHAPMEARIHYVITDGGDAPNIVPEFAEVYYYVRHPNPRQAEALFDRVVKAAEAAAMGTETRMTVEVMHGNYPILPNDALARRMYSNLTKLGGITYSAEERAFAEKIQDSLRAEFGSLSQTLESATEIAPYAFRQSYGSTDVGDVSWAAPTVGLYTATWVPGTPAHSWQAVAAGGMSIGHKGMLLAARTLEATGRDLFTDPELIEAAWAELRERQGPDFEYRALLGDREPPLDYRK